jgi:ABC-type uncharacterized transport system substrate-binding protein
VSGNHVAGDLKGGELIINLKAAKKIGLTIPPEKLILADKVVQ